MTDKPILFSAPIVRGLWAGISGDQWDENPWVAAYTFTVARGNIDAADAPNGEGE
jgi:hypothetical protein